MKTGNYKLVPNYHKKGSKKDKRKLPEMIDANEILINQKLQTLEKDQENVENIINGSSQRGSKYFEQVGSTIFTQAKVTTGTNIDAKPEKVYKKHGKKLSKNSLRLGNETQPISDFMFNPSKPMNYRPKCMKKNRSTLLLQPNKKS